MVSVAIALDISNIAGSSTGFGASIVTHIARSFGSGNNTFPAGNFLESQGGTFAPAAGTFALDPIGSADFYRVNLDNGADEEWNVWFADPATTFDIADLHPASVNVSARTVHADVQAFKMGTGYEAVAGNVAAEDFDGLFGFNGTNLDNLLYYLGAWSSQPCAAGSVCAQQ